MNNREISLRLLNGVTFYENVCNQCIENQNICLLESLKSVLKYSLTRPKFIGIVFSSGNCVCLDEQ